MVSGGTLRDARYSDLPDSDIRKYSKGYRGDPRFVQYCKQFVSLELVDDTGGRRLVQTSSDTSSPEVNTIMRGVQMSQKVGACIGQFVRSYFRGRWFSFGVLVACLCIVISRPAFGRLCGRVVSLILRTCLRRIIGLISVIVDSVLEETVVHLEEALMTSPESIPLREAQNYVVQPQGHSLANLLMNGLCIILGSLLHRTFQWGVAPNVHPPRP